MHLYDSAIIGGGPAGLSAAIYLARFNRSVVVLDRCQGRWSSWEHNENYLGFPEGIASKTLVHRGRQQAERFGAEFLECEVVKIERETIDAKLTQQKDVVNTPEKPLIDGQTPALTGDYFKLVLSSGEVIFSRTVLLATGVTDIFPEFDHRKEYIGRSLFWCITCDGYKVRGKRTVVVGHDDDAAVSCLQFLNFTRDVVMVTNCPPGKADFSAPKLESLKRWQVPLIEGEIAAVHGEKGLMSEIELKTGQHIPAEYMFSHQGAVPHSRLAQELGVEVNSEGYVLCNEEQRTGVPGVYAAGDITRRYAHQIVTAAHEGSMAAQAINYDLYVPEQRH